MGPEESVEKVKLYMMVDGQPVEIAPEIAEIKVSEGQRSGDILPLQECEITMDAHIITVPLIHGRMIYRCEQCGNSWHMYLEKGIEEFGENHKPSPFTIACPFCGGWAMDVSGIQKVPSGGGYVPLPDGCSYFANVEGRDCGVPVFSQQFVKAASVMAKWRGYSLKEIIDELRSEVAEGESPEKVKGEFLHFKTAWDRKEDRERRKAAERVNAASFYRQKERELGWRQQKRTRPRRREYRGPDIV